MNLPLFLLLAYGIAFGLQNKVDFVHGKSAFTDRLLKCTYCTGFHAGWLSWILLRVPHMSTADFNITIPAEIVSYALISAASCYIIDVGILWLERNTPAAS